LLSNIEDAEVSEIFKKCGAGILVEPNSVEALITGFNYLLNNKTDDFSIKSRNFVIENYDRRKQSEKLNSIIIN